jgi:hypothetical protein
MRHSSTWLSVDMATAYLIPACASDAELAGIINPARLPESVN